MIERKPIFITDYTWYPVWKFEGIYEINLYSTIRKTQTGKEVVVYPNNAVVLRHPNGDGSSCCCRVVDVWTSTFLKDKALLKYNYVNGIKKK